MTRCLAKACDETIDPGSWLCLKHWQAVIPEIGNLATARAAGAEINFAYLKSRLATAYEKGDRNRIVDIFGDASSKVFSEIEAALRTLSSVQCEPQSHFRRNDCLIPRCVSAVTRDSWLCPRHWRMLTPELRAELDSIPKEMRQRTDIPSINFSRLKSALAVAFAEQDSLAVAAAVGRSYQEAISTLRGIREGEETWTGM